MFSAMGALMFRAGAAVFCKSGLHIQLPYGQGTQEREFPVRFKILSTAVSHADRRQCLHPKLCA